MTDLYFPRSLKPVVSKGYSMTRRNNVWSVDLAGGGVRQGRDTYYDVFPVSVTLITSAMGRQAFLSFLEKVDGGASSFWMAHDFGMGIEDYQVTITSTIAESTEDGINWTITFTATAEKSPFQDLENQCLINNLPDLYGCYGDCLGSFLKIYANYETTFPRIWSNEGPAGYPPINLLASTLDSRIVYDGPQVYYINRNGNLVQSAANEWPLTFIDGVAVGRVPPENLSTNLYTESATPNAWPYSSSQLSVVTINDGDTNLTTGVLTTVQSRVDAQFLVHEMQMAAGDKVTFSGRVAGVYGRMRCRVAKAGAFSDSCDIELASAGESHTSNFTANVITESDGYINFDATFTAPGDDTYLLQMRVRAAVGDDNIPVGTVFKAQMMQLEAGGIRSSYIATPVTSANRTAASAKVVMGGATSIDITYSDGSVVNVPSVADYAIIPQADSAWGSKYITRIDFNVDG
nr:MAG TPA: hypothetical protein [Caudoviricetes sp.]